MQVHRRSGRLSGSVADCLWISCRCQDELGIAADCLGVSCRCLAGLGDCFGTVTDCLGVSCRCPACLRDCLAPSQTVRKCSAGTQTVLAPSQTVWVSSAGAPPILETVLNRRRLSWSLLQVSRRSWYRLILSGSLLLVP
ncbi:hypothetical protein DPMN_011637 [Dreissena polymorpha]|uniref:Uncharacterized protein n=1 Tax=Dreissena polymorpha TaxID=45954 RepID=A0A9D4N5H3_DREPO|nr:hypothetical protein DPMN_011637 [Dreissena polymorpha]